MKFYHILLTNTALRKASLMSFTVFTILSIMSFYFFCNSSEKTYNLFISSINNSLNIGNYRDVSEKFMSICNQVKLNKALFVVGGISREVKCNSNDSFGYSVKLKYSNNFDMILNFSVKDLVLQNLFFLVFSLVLMASIYLRYQVINKIEEQRLLQLNADNKLKDMAKKLAHDIRSPISTLNLISSKVIDVQIKEILLNATQRINQISNELLEHMKGTDLFDNGQVKQNHLNVAKTTEEFIKELQSEYKINNNLKERKIVFLISKPVEGKIIRHTNLLYPTIKNCIQNSIEATSCDFGEISVLIDLNNKGLMTIKIEDNGVGIPAHVLRKLGSKILTYGKRDSEFSGSGIAIYNAKKDLALVEIDMQISSKLGKGTIVLLTLKKN